MALEMFRQLGIVLMVLGLLAVALRWLRKPGPKVLLGAFQRKSRRLEVLERASLSPQASLALVRLDDEEFLIAVSGANCTRIERPLTVRRAAV